MTKIKVLFAVFAMTALFACGEKKTEAAATTPVQEATTVAQEAIDSTAAEIDAATEELQENMENMKRALDVLK